MHRIKIVGWETPELAYGGPMVNYMAGKMNHGEMFDEGGTKGPDPISFLPQQDPEMMYTDRFNTALNKRQTKRFAEWAAEESKRQGRDILMDKGAYDVQGFWKSGDYKKTDKDGHGTDTWKKPNHPTFSNQSKYHGVNGFYGGNWNLDGGYQPSKQSADMYGPSYYNRMFAEEPGRIEHLDASRYVSGINRPSPLYYKNGGQPGPGPKKPFFPVSNFAEPKYVAGQNPEGHYGYSDNTIWYDPNSQIENVNNPWWLGHEQYHHYQTLTGKNPRERRGQEVDDEVNRMIQNNPGLQFIPKSKLITGSIPDQKGRKPFVGAEDRIYEDPSTLEGEAREYEQYIDNGGKSIFPSPNLNSTNNYPTESAPLRQGMRFKQGGVASNQGYYNVGMGVPRMDEGGEDCRCPEFNCQCPPGYGTATQGDSLRLYQGALAQQNWLKNHPEYKISKNPYRSITRNKILSELELTRQSKDRDVKSKKYYNNIDKNRFEQRELTIGFVNKNVPIGVYDRRIQPNAMVTLQGDQISPMNNLWSDDLNGIVTDVIETPQYDPIYVAPWNTLKPKQQQERLKKYGPKGTPYDPSLKPKPQIKPKPVEPILKKPAPFVPAIKRSVSPPAMNFQIQERKFPKLDIPMSGSYNERPSTNSNIGWNVEYFDPIAKKTQTKHFDNNEEAEEFYNNPANNSSSKYSDVSSYEKKAYGGSLTRFDEGGIPDPCYDEKGYIIPCPTGPIHMNFLTDPEEYLERMKDRQRNQNAMNVTSLRSKFQREYFKNKPKVTAKEFNEASENFWKTIPKNESEDYFKAATGKYAKRHQNYNKKTFLTTVDDTKEELEKYPVTMKFLKGYTGPSDVYEDYYVDPDPERYTLIPKKKEYKTASPFNPQIIPRTFPKLDIPNVSMSGPYMVGYQDWETGQGVDRGFATAEERDAFYKQLSERQAGNYQPGQGNISSYYDANKRNKKFGGNISRFDDGGSTQCPTGMYWDTLLKKCVARPAPFITSDLNEYDRRTQLASDSTNAAVNSRFNIENNNANSATGNTVTISNAPPSLVTTDKSYKDKPKVAKRVTKYKNVPPKRYTTDEYKKELVKLGNTQQASNEFVDNSASVISGNQIINPVAITTYPVEANDYDEKGNVIGDPATTQYIPEFQEAKQEVKYVEPPPKFTLTYLDKDGKQQTLDLHTYEEWKRVKDRFSGSRAYKYSEETGDKSRGSITLGQFGNLKEDPNYPGQAAFGDQNITEYINSDFHNLSDTKQIDDLFDSPPTERMVRKEKYGGDISIPQLPRQNSPLLQFYYNKFGGQAPRNLMDSMVKPQKKRKLD